MTKLASLKKVETIIAIHSAKGGVGKSTVAVNLAVSLASKGDQVGLLDADVHGPSGAIMLGNSEWPSPGATEDTIKPIEAHGIKFISIANMTTRETPLIWRGPMVSNVINQLLANVNWGELDYLIIDMPPGTGDAQLTLSQMLRLTGAIAVSTPQELALEDSIRGIRGFAKVKVPILGLIENMSGFVCDGCGTTQYPFGQSGATIMAEELNIPLLGRLPLEPQICASGDQGEPFVVAHPQSESAQAMERILTKLAQSLAGLKEVATNLDLDWKEMGWSERNSTPPSMPSTNKEAPIAALWQVSYDELGILWQDGKHTTLSVRKMRLACPCAACVNETTGEPILDPESVPSEISLKTIRSVGRYAIHPTFTDGHSTGMYHFDSLARLSKK